MSSTFGRYKSDSFVSSSILDHLFQACIQFFYDLDEPSGEEEKETSEEIGSVNEQKETLVSSSSPPLSSSLSSSSSISNHSSPQWDPAPKAARRILDKQSLDRKENNIRVHCSKEAADASLHAMGVHVGERYVCLMPEQRIISSSPSVSSGSHTHDLSGQKHADASVGAVETIKFVCREFWMNLFGRQATNLHMSTSHDYFVIVDDRFPWLLKCRHRDASRAREVALRLLQFPAGLIEGVLNALGLSTSVSPELGDTLPACRFSIVINALNSSQL